MNDWNEESNPLKDIKDMQEKLKNDVGLEKEADPIYSINFATIEVITDETHLNNQGEPRKDVLIFPNQLVCHPVYGDRLKEGLTLFFGNTRYVNQIQPPK